MAVHQTSSQMVGMVKRVRLAVGLILLSVILLLFFVGVWALLPAEVCLAWYSGQDSDSYTTYAITVGWQWSLWVVLEMAAAVILVGLIFYSGRVFPLHGRGISQILLLIGALLLFLHAMEIGTISFGTKFLYNRLQLICYVAMATTWVAFVLRYVRPGGRFALHTILLLSIMPVITVVLVLTNDLHHLLWTGSFQPGNNSYLFVYEVGLLWWVLAIYTSGMLVYGFYVLVRSVQSIPEHLRGDVWGLLIVGVIVFVTALFDVADIERYTAIPLLPSAWGFLGACLVLILGLKFLRSLHMRSMAQQTVMDSITDAILVLDNQSRIMHMNAAGEQLTGYALDRVHQHDIKEVLRTWPKLILDIVRKSSSPFFEEVMLEDDGKRSWCEVNCFPIRDSTENLVGRVLLVRDVTSRVKVMQERKEIERRAHLASRLATVGQMAAGVAHEINNPLTSVLGYSDLLMTGDLSEDVKRDLKHIHEGGQRVANIVKQLLAFARNIAPERKPVDINDIVRTTLDLRAYQLKRSDIKVITELAPDLPYTVADAGQLEQVFINIVLNAETEMKLAHGRGTLLVKTERVDDFIRISFKDDGSGISEENIEKIFDPFFTTRKVGEGTGLGLSVCHGIVVEHNGRIYAQSKLGEGATFIIELPILAEPKQLELQGAAPQEAQPVSRGKILVVDDELSILQFLERLLTDEGHEVDVADNATDALRLFRAKRYSLILLDVLMPEMSGIALYKKLQKMDQSVHDKVIFITGDVLGKATEAFLVKTRAPYVRKPFDLDELRMKINQVMGQNS